MVSQIELSPKELTSVVLTIDSFENNLEFEQQIAHYKIYQPNRSLNKIFVYSFLNIRMNHPLDIDEIEIPDSWVGKTFVDAPMVLLEGKLWEAEFVVQQ